MPEEIIRFNDVHFSYAGEPDTVLNGSSFTVHRGDCVALKGESGSGKTTLFRLILGFEHPQSGEISFKTQPLNTDVIHQIRNECAWLPQDLNLGSGTVKEVVAVLFQFSANVVTKPEQDEIKHVFEQLGLEPNLLQNKFSELSTGQRQRVGIALCHLLRKPLILLDEPTSALDKASKQKAIDLLFGNTERTILSTSHDPYWIERCGKVVELN